MDEISKYAKMMYENAEAFKAKQKAEKEEFKADQKATLKALKEIEARADNKKYAVKRQQAIKDAIQYLVDHPDDINDDLKVYDVFIEFVGGYDRKPKREDIKLLTTEAMRKILSNDDLYWNNIDDTKGNLYDMVKALKSISWTVSKESIIPFIREMILLNGYVHYNGEIGNDSNLYITSPIERNGKSFLRSNIARAYEKIGVRTAPYACWPTGPHADVRPFATNLIAEIDDTSYDSIRNVNEDQLKAILRKNKTTAIPMNLKNRDPITIPSRAKVLACGNVTPPLKGDSTWRIINTNSVTAKEALNTPELKELVQRDMTAPVEIAMKLERDAEYLFDEAVKDIENRLNGPSDKPLVALANKYPDLFELSELVNGLDCEAKAKDIFIKRLLEESGCYNYGKAVALAKLANRLVGEGVVRKVGNCKREEYTHWDFSQLYGVDLTSYLEESLTPVEEVLDAMKVWDEILAALEPYKPADPDKIWKEAEDMFVPAPETKITQKTYRNGARATDELAVIDIEWEEPKHTYQNKGSYEKVSLFATDGKDDEFETVNPIQEGCGRRDDAVEPGKMTRYLFEMDDIPIEEQMRIIEPLYESGVVARAVHSAGKSIHCIVQTNISASDKEEYKWIWNQINSTYFEGKADKNCGNPSRTTRHPGGRRLDKGSAEQKLVFPPQNKGLDVSKLHEHWPEIKKYKKLQRAIWEERNKNTQNQKPNFNSIRDWVLSWDDGDFKYACIDMLNGNAHYDTSQLFGFAKICKKNRWTWEEFTFEVPELSRWGFTQKTWGNKLGV